MADKEQTYKSHRRFFPWHHYVVVPIMIVNFVVQTINYIDNMTMDALWPMILSVGLLIFSFTSRSMSLKAQDRVIRLEERLRLSHLLPGEVTTVNSLRTSQLVALRFAPDDEVPDLVRRITAGELQKSEEIKKAIRNWRPDYLRV